MPIQKPKSFFVNVTGSETNGRLLVGFTTHNISVLTRFLATRAGDRKPTKRSSIAGRSVHAELGSVDILKLCNEQVQIEIENASELKKFPLEVSHAGFVFRGDVPSKRYQRSVFFQQLS